MLRRALCVVHCQGYLVKELFTPLTWSRRDYRCVRYTHFIQYLIPDMKLTSVDNYSFINKMVRSKLAAGKITI